jgi:hypothetical protein
VYVIRRIADARYPLCVIEQGTNHIAGRYRPESEAAARKQCSDLNGSPYTEAVSVPYDSELTINEAVARARTLGDKSDGDGWRRLLWRMADLLEDET